MERIETQMAYSGDEGKKGVGRVESPQEGEGGAMVEWRVYDFWMSFV